MQTLRTLRTVTNILIDPLAQTFILDADTQCTGADLWFTACGGDATIEIRETSNGVPTKTVLARGKVKKASVIVSGGGYTRITFDAPVLLSAGVEYALVVLADEAVTSVSMDSGLSLSPIPSASCFPLPTPARGRLIRTRTSRSAS